MITSESIWQFLSGFFTQVARTCNVLSPTTPDDQSNQPLYSGYLWKQGGHVSGIPTNKWIRRWFCIKRDNCLYSYKTDQVSRRLSHQHESPQNLFPGHPTGRSNDAYQLRYHPVRWYWTRSSSSSLPDLLEKARNPHPAPCSRLRCCCSKVAGSFDFRSGT